jgi:hypothetical protein
MQSVFSAPSRPLLPEPLRRDRAPRRRAKNALHSATACRRPIKMSPLCQFEMTLPADFPGGRRPNSRRLAARAGNARRAALSSASLTPLMPLDHRRTLARFSGKIPVPSLRNFNRLGAGSRALGQTDPRFEFRDSARDGPLRLPARVGIDRETPFPTKLEGFHRVRTAR